MDEHEASSGDAEQPEARGVAAPIPSVLRGIRQAFRQAPRKAAYLLAGVVLPLWLFAALWPAVLQATSNVASNDPLKDAVTDLVDRSEDADADAPAGVVPAGAGAAVDGAQQGVGDAREALADAVGEPTDEVADKLRSAIDDIGDGLERAEERLDAAGSTAAESTRTVQKAQAALDDAESMLEMVEGAGATLDADAARELQAEVQAVGDVVETLEDEVASDDPDVEAVTISKDPGQAPTAGEIGAAITVISKVDRRRGVGVVKFHPFDRGRVSFELSSEMLLFYLVLVVGAFGGALRSLVSFADLRTPDDVVRMRWPVGGGVAILVYFLIRGGFLQVGASGANLNPYTIVAVSALAGMFATEIVGKLRRAATRAISASS